MKQVSREYLAIMVVMRLLLFCSSHKQQEICRADILPSVGSQYGQMGKKGDKSLPNLDVYFRPCPMSDAHNTLCNAECSAAQCIAL